MPSKLLSLLYCTEEEASEKEAPEEGAPNNEPSQVEAQEEEAPEEAPDSPSIPGLSSIQRKKHQTTKSRPKE